MDTRWEMLRQLSNLTNPVFRAEAIQKISAHLEVETFIIFVADPETGELLAAPGFPQTLSPGRVWRDFLKRCMTEGDSQAQLSWGSPGESKPVQGMKCGAAAVIVFIGGQPSPHHLEELLAILPCIAMALRGERLGELQMSQTRFAEESARQSSTLARRLDQARRRLQEQLNERQRAEAALREAREELQRHAADLEAERITPAINIARMIDRAKVLDGRRQRRNRPAAHK